MKSKTSLNNGIPTIKDYENFLESDLFSLTEDYSDKFIKSNNDILTAYSKKWVKDPLHQWSRQWEYPFVYNAIANTKKISKPIEILDAGSGITFFPYFISSNFKKAKITCVDSDTSLKEMFSSINQRSKKKINFTSSDIRKLPFKNHFFDIIYCISVLEHTKNYEEIIKEFKRILKPNGVLIITFDISIDGNNDMSPKDAREFMKILSKYFPTEKNVKTDTLIEKYKSQDIVSTKYIKSVNKKLLPWKHPLLSNLKRIFKFHLPTRSGIKNLTFFCYAFKLFPQAEKQ